VKRFLFLAFIGLLAVSTLVVADTYYPRTYMAVCDTATVDNQWTDTIWDSLTNVVVDRGDTAFVICRVTGLAYLRPFDKLYMGFDDDTTAGYVTVPEDTGIINLPPDVKNPCWQSFSFTQKIDLADGTDSDTLFLLMAASSNAEAISLQNLFIDVLCVDSAS